VFGVGLFVGGAISGHADRADQLSTCRWRGKKATGKEEDVHGGNGAQGI
jgi:hypothetical protein